MAITDVCIHCGTPLDHPKAGQYYCGTTCQLIHRFGPPRPCAFCQAMFQPRWKGNLYCGTACHDLAQRRSPDLVCEHCGRTFHHIKSWADYPESRFDLDNGLLLCAQHHLQRHGKAGMGMIRPQRPEPACAVCSVPISGQGATGLCHKHALEAYSARRYRTQWEKDRRLGKTCRACGIGICDDTVSGYCRAHVGPYISATRWPSKAP